MTFFVPKGKRFRVTASDSWHDFSSDDDQLGPVKVHFDGGSVVITQNKDAILLDAFGPGDWRRAAVMP